MQRLLYWLFIICLLQACGGNPPNSPYSKEERESNRYYTSFSERPKTLDPARAYSANEYEFIAQILEPPLQYHYLKRPYKLIPLTLMKMPEAIYLDQAGNPIPKSMKSQAAMTRYHFTLMPGIKYSLHPGFAKKDTGEFLYHALEESPDQLKDFEKKDTRELIAADYVYQIKRLADPKNRSPILSIMENYIVGLKDLSEQLEQERQKNKGYLDLRQFDLAGTKLISDYEWEVTIKGQYPQFLYWLAMPFFAPTPWEVDKFYSQAVLEENNISFDWYPVGTGAYELAINNPNRLMVLRKNSEYHGENFPKEGDLDDIKNGLLQLSGKPLPFIDEFYYYLEKESIPRWAKFIQGYYDRSGVGSDSFDQAIQLQADGKAVLTDSMDKQKIQLNTAVTPSVYYLGFNMLSEKVGGYKRKQAYLRQAISIAVDMEEFISIFMNGQGVPAQSPIPPGIFGYSEDFNPYVYEKKNGHVQRKSIEEAKRLLARAGYPNGIDPKTKHRLQIYFDVTGSQGPDDKARFDWFRKQFKKLGIQLIVRATQYNRFQEKIRTGNFELFFLGWNADYPDPENFLFLLYGPNSKVKHHGENASNYSNADFDRAFRVMRSMDNTPKRQEIINTMNRLVQYDAPWIFGFNPKSFLLSHQWLYPVKLNAIASNTLKYQKIDPKKRARLQVIWNAPKYWPILVLILLCLILAYPISKAILKKENQI